MSNEHNQQARQIVTAHAQHSVVVRQEQLADSIAAALAARDATLAGELLAAVESAADNYCNCGAVRRVSEHRSSCRAASAALAEQRLRAKCVELGVGSEPCSLPVVADSLLVPERGVFANDPTWDSFQQSIQGYRDQVDASERGDTTPPVAADARKLVHTCAVNMERSEANERVFVTAAYDTLVERITTYANQRGEQLWREGMERAAKEVCDACGNDAKYGAAHKVAGSTRWWHGDYPCAAGGIWYVLNQPDEKSCRVGEIGVDSFH